MQYFSKSQGYKIYHLYFIIKWFSFSFFYLEEYNFCIPFPIILENLFAISSNVELFHGHFHVLQILWNDIGEGNDLRN